MKEEGFQIPCTFTEKAKKFITLPQVIRNSLFQRSFLEEHEFSFDRGQWVYNEYPFYLQTMLEAKRIVFTPKIVVHHRVNRPGSIARGYGGRFENRSHLLETMWSLAQKRPLLEEAMIVLHEMTDIHQLYIKSKDSHEKHSQLIKKMYRKIYCHLVVFWKDVQCLRLSKIPKFKI